ncbi:MAG: heavy metal translocating P-type ATPase, partial [Calditrichia bacterium]
MQTRIKTSEPTTTELQCYHCGLPCPNDDIRIGDRYFCCNGCRMVYEILKENDLCQYYNLNSTPGLTRNEINLNARFGYLDDESVQQQLINFSDGQASRVTFFIPNIHCSSCIWLLENLHKINPAILSSRVDFLKKEISISYEEKNITLREVVELLASLGYEPQISLENLQTKVKNETDRSLYLKLGVAGFAFANIMLFSLPEYLSGGNLEPFLKQFFQYLNIMLALPVFFYSSLDFFKSAYSGLKHRTVNIDVPVSLGILTLFFRSLYEILANGNAGYMDSFVALVFLLLVGKLFQKKTYDSLSFERDYKSYFPISVTLIRNGKQDSIPLSKLKKGDRILVRNQELIPADAILISPEAQIDYSFVTGESNPAVKHSGDFIYAGGRRIGSAIELDVVKDVSQSYLTQLWNSNTFNEPGGSKISTLADVVAHYFTIIVIAIASAAFLYWLPQNMGYALNAFTAVLIIACPCALALSSPFTLGTVMRIFGKNKFYLKNTAVIERFAKIDEVVFDKTGTLTLSQQAGIKFISSNGKTDFTPYEKKLIKSVMHNSTHPLSRNLDRALDTDGRSVVEDFREFPGQGIEGKVEGHFVKIGSPAFVGSNPVPANGRAASLVAVSIDGVERGSYQLENVYRPGLDKVIAGLGNSYNLTLLTGDNESERDNLLRHFPGADALHFNQTPFDKLAYIKNLQKEGRQVLMIGDGLNDAGALKQSDVGIAISEDL